MSQVIKHSFKDEIEKQEKKEKIFKELIDFKINLAVGFDCPLCLKEQPEHIGKLRARSGKFGNFLSCSNFPSCTFSWKPSHLDVA